MKAVLAVMGSDPELERVSIVAELSDAETARALREAGGGRVLTVRAADVIARITAQACRQAGLSLVCRDLLDFEGDEIYLQPAPERLLVGWNSLGPVILRELDQFVLRGSTVDVLADGDLVDPNELVDVQLDNLAETYRPPHGDLDQLSAFVAEHHYDKVIILGYRSGVSPAEADARTLLTLLLIQRAMAHEGERRSRIVTELLDSRDVELARATGADDFVVSDELSSLMMAQLAERRELEPVLADLFDVEGSALSIKPASWYVRGRAPFARVVAAARARGEIAIGYRADGDDGNLPRVHLNPPKSETIELGAGDQVVVIAPV